MGVCLISLPHEARRRNSDHQVWWQTLSSAEAISPAQEQALFIDDTVVEEEQDTIRAWDFLPAHQSEFSWIIRLLPFSLSPLQTHRRKGSHLGNILKHPNSMSLFSFIFCLNQVLHLLFTFSQGKNEIVLSLTFP